MSNTVGGGIDRISNAVDKVAKAPGAVLDGDVKEAVTSLVGTTTEVKRGIVETAIGVIKAPIDGVKSLLGINGNNADARDGAQRAVEKHT